MEQVIFSNDREFYSPPSRGLSLGWRLALSTALITSLVMGVISISQHRIDLKNDRYMHQELLKMSLAPLAARLEGSMSVDSMAREAEEFHAAYSKKGYPVHEVILSDNAGDKVFSTSTAISENSDHYLQANVPIASAVLNGGKGTLLVLKDSKEYLEEVRNNWLLWLVHFIVTVSVIFLFLTIAIYFQVTKPVNRLVQGVKKMEMGYWGTIDLDSGAWEIRWLAWRFSNMVQEVHSAVSHLFEAEKKAGSAALKYDEDSVAMDSELSVDSGLSENNPADTSVYEELLVVCERLKSAHPNDLSAVKLAHEVWQHEVLKANQHGFYQLKVQLEDEALRLIEPDLYKTLNDQLSGLQATWHKWMDQLHDDLYKMLEDRAIPCVNILHRVKHTAGVWIKMQSKGLSLDEINDLYAFRIIVPTEADCYVALGITHQSFKPVISRFKDYIARPKQNGYQSLHTCVAADDGPVFEIQIRSIAMDQQAEKGDAAHWAYKKDNHKIKHKPSLLQWWLGFWNQPKVFSWFRLTRDINRLIDKRLMKEKGR